MLPRLLLDTHVVIRWLIDTRRLSKEQLREMDGAVRRGEPLGVSAISLLEIAILESQRKLRLKGSLEELFTELEASTAFRLLPLSYEVALEAALVGALRDPADRAIVATARAHRLRLVTSDQRIIDSRLVSVVE